MTVRLDGTGTSGRPPTLVGHKGPSSAASQLFVVRKEASAVVIQPVDTWYNFRAVYEGEQAPTLAPMDEEDQAKDAAARAQFAALMSDASREAFLKEQRGEMGDAARSRDTQKVRQLTALRQS